MRRIVKIAVRFLHTKTALCDRKDTQSRFAVNAARSIVCVGTPATGNWLVALGFNAARSIVCVGTELSDAWRTSSRSFNAARSIVCVETQLAYGVENVIVRVSMPHAALCVSRPVRNDWHV